jgi:hypothetical protein
MICRSKVRALQAQEEILKATSTDQVKVLLVRNLYVYIYIVVVVVLHAWNHFGTLRSTSGA